LEAIPRICWLGSGPHWDPAALNLFITVKKYRKGYGHIKYRNVILTSGPSVVINCALQVFPRIILKTATYVHAAIQRFFSLIAAKARPAGLLQ
jgi:hypothetical protein